RRSRAAAACARHRRSCRPGRPVRRRRYRPRQPRECRDPDPWCFLLRTLGGPGQALWTVLVHEADKLRGVSISPRAIVRAADPCREEAERISWSAAPPTVSPDWW